MKSNETLKPCPFCGATTTGDDDIHVGVTSGNELMEDISKIKGYGKVKIVEGTRFLWVACFECHANGPRDRYKTEEEATAAWNKRAGEMNDRDKRVIEWFASGDSGVSGETLCACFYGMLSKKKYKHHPGDPGDFGRCKRFLELLFPEDKTAVLQAAAQLSPEWKALVENWDYLESIYGCDNMFAEMQKIIKEANRDGE